MVGGSNPFQNSDLIKTPENVYRVIGSGSAAYNLITRESQTLDFTLQGGLDSYIDHAKVISPRLATSNKPMRYQAPCSTATATL